MSAISSAEGRPISIFISDDSADGTNAEVCSSLASEYSFIKLSKNNANIGIDANIQKAIEVCDCDFAWLIGEDDEFLPGAVAAMYDFLQECTSPFIFSPYLYVSEDHNKVLGSVEAAHNKNALATVNFIENYLWAIGFIGAVVVNVDAWRSTNAAPYLGTYFAHVGRILDMVSNESLIQVQSSCGVANRSEGGDTFTWKKDSFGVFLGFERMCEIAARRNPQLEACLLEASINYRKKFPYFSIKTTFRLRAEGAFDYNQFLKYLAPLSSIGVCRKIWLFGLSLTPTIFLRPIAAAYRVFNKNRTLQVKAKHGP